MKTEHEITYAYPTSVDAVRAGFAKDGCYTLKAGEMFKGFKVLDGAKIAALQAGTSPGRWSIDHPANARFL